MRRSHHQLLGRLCCSVGCASAALRPWRLGWCYAMASDYGGGRQATPDQPPGMQRALRAMLCCRHLSNAGKAHIEEAITTEEQWVVLANHDILIMLNEFSYTKSFARRTAL